MFPVLQVDSRRAVSVEPLGTKRKFWFRDEKNRQTLFKAEERGTGEDWAEKVACELAGMLGLPHVHYELAEEMDGRRPGVVCETCAAPPVALALGNQLLLALDPEYPAGEGRKYKVREHTVEAVGEVMIVLQPPPGAWMRGIPDGIASALNVFIGYVMLDAWIANQDRHHENWGVLVDRAQPAGRQFALAPTFDHGASMARNLTDEERHERLTTRDSNRQIAAFARKAKSAFYAAGGPDRTLTTIEAWRAFSRLSPDGSKIWLERLEAFDDSSVDRLLAEVPPNRLSPVGRDFTRQLLAENRRRVLEGDER